MARDWLVRPIRFSSFFSSMVVARGSAGGGGLPASRSEASTVTSTLQPLASSIGGGIKGAGSGGGGGGGASTTAAVAACGLADKGTMGISPCAWVWKLYPQTSQNITSAADAVAPQSGQAGAARSLAPHSEQKSGSVEA